MRRGALVKGRLFRALSGIIAVLALNAPAFANHGSFSHPAVWINEIDFTASTVEFMIGSASLPSGDYYFCYGASGGSDETCVAISTRDDSAIAAGARHTQSIFGGAPPRGSMRIDDSEAEVVVSFVQWGVGNQDDAADAVTAGIWSDANDFVPRPTTAGHSMQYDNPHNVVPGPAVWFSDPATLGDENTPVELVSFSAQGVADGVRLRWRTESETANTGFRILRSNSEGGPFQSVHDDLVPGQGSTPHAADYEHVDETAEPGTLYHYQLEDVAHDGQTEQSEAVSARTGTPR